MKKALLHLIESAGYRVFSKSLHGVSLADDLARLIQTPTPAVFDVGANCGQTVAWVKARFPRARIWSYEPDPRPFAELQRVAASHADVECIAGALGSKTGQLPLHRNADSVTNSLLTPSAQDQPLPYQAALAPVDTLTVEVRTVTDEMARLGLARLQLLKTDCQGFDFEVVRGAEANFDRGEVDLVLSEVLFHREYDGQAWFHEILPWMLQKRFAFHGLYDVVHAPDGRALFANALFRRA